MRTSTRKGLRTALLLGTSAIVPTILAGCGSVSEPVAMGRTTEPSTVAGRVATFNDEGELVRPENHREWVFIGAPVTPNDLNDGHAAFPEFHNVYIDPASFAAYKRTGEFRDGTVILKELVSVGGKQMPSGNGYFQGEFHGLEAMVKDHERFHDEPGGWAFFRFGEAPHYQAAGTRMQTENCNLCHSGANQDYVFTATYPVLRAARPDASSK